MDNIVDLFSAHPALADDLRFGQTGYSIPSFEELEVIEVTSETVPHLQERGILVVDAELGSSNKIYLDASMKPTDVKLRFNNTNNNSIIIEKEAKLKAYFVFEGGGGHMVSIGGYSENNKIITRVLFRNSNNVFYVGKGGSIASLNAWIEGPNRSIIIGDDPMFAPNVDIRNADSHAMIDIKTASTINLPGKVLIEPHVWLGQDTIVMKNTVIGTGSVVGARSVVSKNVPPCSCAAGVPAQVVRKQVSWTRPANPSSEYIKGIMELPILKEEIRKSLNSVTGTQTLEEVIVNSHYSNDTLLGSFDSFDDLYIFGWAINEKLPNFRVHLEVYVDDEFAGAPLAGIERQDLAKAKIGKDGQCSFRFRIPERFCDGEPHVIDIRFMETGKSLNNSPKTVTIEKAPEEPADKYLKLLVAS